MDDTEVCVSGVDGWRDCCAGMRVDALFVGPGVGNCDTDAPMAGVEAFDPGLPVVIVGERPEAARSRAGRKFPVW